MSSKGLAVSRLINVSVNMSPRAAENERDPTLPDCGPGYALLMIGYFFEGSKFVGRKS